MYSGNAIIDISQMTYDEIVFMKKMMELSSEAERMCEIAKRGCSIGSHLVRDNNWYFFGDEGEVLYRLEFGRPGVVFECLKQEYFCNSSKHKALCFNDKVLQVAEKFREFVNEVEKLQSKEILSDCD